MLELYKNENPRLEIDLPITGLSPLVRYAVVASRELDRGFYRLDKDCYYVAPGRYKGEKFRVSFTGSVIAKMIDDSGVLVYSLSLGPDNLSEYMKKGLIALDYLVAGRTKLAIDTLGYDSLATDPPSDLSKEAADAIDAKIASMAELRGDGPYDPEIHCPHSSWERFEYLIEEMDVTGKLLAHYGY